MRQMGTENRESCSQRDSAERKGYVRAHRSFNRIWKERGSAEPAILGKILDKDNRKRAYKRVKANKGAPGVDRIIQQAILQQLIPIYEPLFSDDSFGYRPGRGAKDAIFRIKEYTGTSTKYLEETLKLKVNREKSRTVSVFAIRNFKYLGFCFGKNGKGIYIRVHGKSWKKAKEKRTWKQWKLPKTRERKRMGQGMPEWVACEGAYSRKAYWRMAGSGAVQRALTKERLINRGFYDLATAGLL